MKKLFLYGPPASGKTTLGQRLAAQLGRRFVDLDAAIVASAGRTIPEIFAADGEAAFRDLEAAALRRVVADADIVALGGGTLLRAESRAFAEANGIVLCLDAPSEAELERRMGQAPGSRPLGNRARERADHYASFSHRIHASFMAGESLVVVGKGFALILVDGIPVVADENVATRYPLSSVIYRLPSGERNKTPENVLRIWHAFAEAGLGRHDAVVAVGGGVTGDMTGFAAATWMRGMNWINVPTTLLAMVDASTGGKTGCDLPEGKNLAGAFHAPQLVVIDTDFLQTLSPDLLACGKAEMIKHEIIAGRRILDIAENLLVKVGIVREDPFETRGRRLLLNCGHTVGHAVERLTHYALSHGEAVAIGCVAEARMAVRLNLAPAAWPDELTVRFAEEGLPTELPPGLDLETLRPVMRGDKKRTGDVVMFALPCGWGDVRAVPINLAEPLAC